MSRRAFTEKAVEELSTEEVDLLRKVEHAKYENDHNEEAQEPDKVIHDVIDEICSDNVYNQAEETEEVEKVNSQELARGC